MPVRSRVATMHDHLTGGHQFLYHPTAGPIRAFQQTRKGTYEVIRVLLLVGRAKNDLAVISVIANPSDNPFSVTKNLGHHLDLLALLIWIMLGDADGIDPQLSADQRISEVSQAG